MSIPLTRRRLLTTALAAGAAVPLGAGPGRAAPTRLTLPAPTGPHPVGVVSLSLADPARPGRELMTSIWYPARDVRRYPVVPWLAAAPLRAILASVGLDPEVAASPLTAGHRGAPVLRAAGRRPVVVYSHGAGGHRSETTVVVQELAGHGYVVVTVDHPEDSYGLSSAGRLVVPDDDVSVTPWDHARDIRTVLDHLEDLATGSRRHELPAGLGATLDLRRVGMFGWSKGATATALVMNTDRRVGAGLSLDGPMQSQPPATDLDRPFMLMTAEFTPGARDSGVAEFWPLLRGWRRQLHTRGAHHASYCDQEWLLPQLPGPAVRSDQALDPAVAVRIQQAYPPAFFDRHLRHRRQPLLDGPSPAFPAVCFVS